MSSWIVGLVGRGLELVSSLSWFSSDCRERQKLRQLVNQPAVVSL